MKKQNTYTNSEDGFVLIASLLILLVLTVVGIAVNRNTTIEWQIAMNDRFHKETFYNADAATELASEVLEQAIACSITGFSQKELQGTYPIKINKSDFWRNYADTTAMPDEPNTPLDPLDPNDPDRPNLVFYTPNGTPEEHANINIGGNTQLTAGAAIMVASGYWGGAGKSLAVNGAVLLYDIKVQQIGKQNSQSKISIQYGHVLGTEGSCNY